MHKIQRILTQNSVVSRFFCYFTVLLFINSVSISFAQKWRPHELPVDENYGWRAVDRIGHGVINQVCYSPEYSDGQVYLAVVTSIGVELHWDGNRQLYQSNAPIEAFSFHPTEKVFAIVDENEEGEYVPQLWEITDVQGTNKKIIKDYVLYKYETDAGKVSLDFSDDGNWLAIGYDREIVIWKFDEINPDVETRVTERHARPIYPESQPEGSISSICFGTTHAEEMYLAAAISVPEAENKIWIGTLDQESEKWEKAGEIECQTNGEIFSSASNRNGYLAIGTEDEDVNIELWELFPENGELYSTYENQNFTQSLPNPPVFQVVLHPHKNILGAITKYGGTIYQIDEDKESPLEGINEGLSLSFHPDKDYLAFAGKYNIEVLDRQTQNKISEFPIYTKAFKTLAIDENEDSKTVVAATTEKVNDEEKSELIVWNGFPEQQWERKSSLYEVPGVVYSLSVNKSEGWAAMGTEMYSGTIYTQTRTVDILDLASFQSEENLVEKLAYEYAKSEAIRFNTQGNKLIIGTTSNSNRGTVVIFNTESGEVTDRISDDNTESAFYPVTSINFAPDETRFAVGTGDEANQNAGELLLWTEKNKLQLIYELQSPVVDIAFVSDNKVAVATSDNKIWIIDTGSKSEVFPPKELKAQINSIDYNNDGELVIATENCIEVRNSSDLTLLNTLEGHTDEVTEVIGDGQDVISSSKDGTILFWKTKEMPEETLTVQIVEPEDEDYISLQKLEIELNFGQEVWLDSIKDDIKIFEGEKTVEVTNLRLSEEYPEHVILELNLEEVREYEKEEDVTIEINLPTEVNTLYGPQEVDPQQVELSFKIGVGVWPGDTNNDETVDVLDILPFGLYNYYRGQEAGTGTSRPDASDKWKMQVAKPWDPDKDDYDRAYADANGDGVIDEYDIEPIAKNWSKPQGIAHSPMIDTNLAENNSQSFLEIYKRMYSVLENLEFENEGVIVLKKTISQIIARLQKRHLPLKTKLLQNFPNPFNPETWIPYQLAVPASVSIEIYDLTGHLVRKLKLGQKEAGFYVDKAKAGYWNGCNEFGERVASGLYFYRLDAGSFSAQKRFVILK